MKEEIEYFERLSALFLSKNEKEIIKRDIEEIFRAFEFLSSLKIEKPVSLHAVEIKNVLREDKVKKNKDAVDFLKKSRLYKDRYILGPKTVLEE